MGIPYLKNLPWSRWTRDERYFCSILYSQTHHNPAEFASWLIRASTLDLEPAGNWDLGYEVCFYRDFLWQLGGSAKHNDLPTKRTFDLCLFGERALIVIEAKVSEAFDAAQNQDFGRDKERIKSLPGLGDLEVRVVALASSTYFANAQVYGHPGTLDIFDGRVSWSQIAQKYPDVLLDQADRLYKLKPGAFL
ncbi:MAG TPA: hypothetical protein VLX29_05030 [Nitrospirota bacterium]|nr:hypothetical protein [Nitrospirota bacterium]